MRAISNCELIIALLRRLIPLRLSQEISRRRGGAFRDPKGASQNSRTFPSEGTDGTLEDGPAEPR